MAAIVVPGASTPPFNEKDDGCIYEAPNPVVADTELAYQRTNLVEIDAEGVELAAKYIHAKLLADKYTPRTWRTHSLHLCPTEPHSPTDPWNNSVLDWIFLISALNFSFWSEKEGRSDRYGVDWQVGWENTERKVWTGYWSLVAALNRAIQDDELPITDPKFYSSETLCPDSVIEHVFRAAPQCTETIPLLKERIAIMREVGTILCTSFGGSFGGFISDFHRRHFNQGTAIDLVKMVVETFPSFRDQVSLDGRQIRIWKRAQILVADSWAAFYPASPELPHPLYPGLRGPEIQNLTMFADYRVPQILHHLKILTYPPELVTILRNGTMLETGCREELSLRAASIVAVERVRSAMLTLIQDGPASAEVTPPSSVLIDFFLWDLAKRVERGEEHVEGIETADVVPAHRTRSIWY